MEDEDEMEKKAMEEPDEDPKKWLRCMLMKILPMKIQKMRWLRWMMTDMDPSDEDSEEMEMEGVIEIDGVKYAPVVSEEEDEDEMDEMMKDDEDEDME